MQPQQQLLLWRQTQQTHSMASRMCMQDNKACLEAAAPTFVTCSMVMHGITLHIMGTQQQQ
jgi:hypothetical protein